MEERLREQLDRRRDEGTLRSILTLPRRSEGGDISVLSAAESISASKPSIDFSSNDYLGLARCPSQLGRVHAEYESFFLSGSAATAAFPALGATGSRLLSGDSVLARSIEARLAHAHNRPSALICNSGYDANLSVLSSVPLPGDVIVMDELVHNSLIMGVRMSRLSEERTLMFRHNDVSDLENVLRKAMRKVKGNEHNLKPEGNVVDKWPQIIVVIESVYSMDGDIAPIEDILNLSKQCGASVVVDEAHGLGVYGRGNRMDMILPEKQSDLGFVGKGIRTGKGANSVGGGTGVLAALELEGHPALLCSIHTFGKAAGCHGAVIAASETLIDFLVNYARPFVYSTALPPHSLVAITCAYDSMTGLDGGERRTLVFGLVRLFRRKMIELLKLKSSSINSVLLPSPSPIQAVLVPGNNRCIALSNRLKSEGNFQLYPIRSPTVPKGEERIRIILHSHNTEDEVRLLVKMLAASIKSFGLVPGNTDSGSIISKL